MKYLPLANTGNAGLVVLRDGSGCEAAIILLSCRHAVSAVGVLPIEPHQ
jgi:hypothetical protein